MEWNQNRMMRPPTTGANLRTLNRVLHLDDDRTSADAQVNPTHREYAQQPRMTGQDDTSNLMENTAFRQGRDWDFSPAENRPEFGRYQQVRGSFQQQHEGPDFPYYNDFREEFEQGNPNVVYQNNGHHFGSPMQYPAMDTEPRWQQQQTFVPSHDRQPLSALQNQGVAATAPVQAHMPRGERFHDESSIGINSESMYIRQPPRSEVIAGQRTSLQASTPLRENRNYPRPSNQRAEVAFRSSPAVRHSGFARSGSPVLSSPADMRRVAVTPSRLHQAANNFAGGQNGRSQMRPFEVRQGQPQIGFDQRISSMYHANLAGTAIRTPEVNGGAALAGGSQAMPLHQDEVGCLLHEESGEDFDAINHPSYVPVRSKEQALAVERALELRLPELQSLCRKHACSDNCGLYPSDEALTRIYHEFESQNYAIRRNPDNSREAFVAIRRRAVEEFNKIRGSISRSASRPKPRSYRGVQGHVSEQESFETFSLRMAKSKAIQDLLKEWYNSDVTGHVDANPERQDRVISEIPSSLMAYLSAIYNVDPDTSMKQRYQCLLHEYRCHQYMSSNMS